MDKVEVDPFLSTLLIVRQELNDAEGWPVVGTSLRNRVAKQLGAGFEAALAGRKFRDALLERPDILTVVSRFQQDFLVLPPERPEILANMRGRVSLRRDLHRALSRYGVDEIPAYRTENDEAFFAGAQDEEPLTKGQLPGILPLPGTTLANERKLRSDFVNTSSLVPQAKAETLQSALDSATGLQTFTRELFNTGLKSKWDAYRTSFEVARLARWCLERSVRWRPEWLTLRQVGQMHLVEGETTELIASPRTLEELLARISHEELSRVMIPVDVVLRLLSRR